MFRMLQQGVAIKATLRRRRRWTSVCSVATGSAGAGFFFFYEFDQRAVAVVSQRE